MARTSSGGRQVRNTDEIRKNRTQARHNLQNAGGGASLVFLANSFMPESWTLSANQIVALTTLVCIGGAAVPKFMSEYQIVPKLMSKILKTSLVVGLGLTMGCAFTAGTQAPVEMRGTDGDPIIAYETKGLSWAFWDGAVGGIESGNGGQATVSILGDLFDGLRRIAGGMVTGLAAMGGAVGGADGDEI